jgi:microbial collagenase
MLEMVVFASSTDYQIYSNAMFGNATNNGGIYLEGDPAATGNQARFLCYVAEWLNPFQIWNLTHEYIHYNDGRYDMYGAFGDYPQSAPGSAVWYIEGLAEYLSYSFRELGYFDAVEEAAVHRYSLSETFDNSYASGQVRVYNWGYLAARFMFENHIDQIAAMLADFRSGDYGAYGVFLKNIHDTHDEEWDSWLTCFSTNDGDTSTCGGSGNSETGIFHDGFDVMP